MASTISVIIPAYNEEDNTCPLYRELKGVLDSMAQPYEILFIDWISFSAYLNYWCLC